MQRRGRGRRGRSPAEGGSTAAAEVGALRNIRTAMSAKHVRALFGVMMHVHGLDADPPWTGHARQAHVRAPEEPGPQLLKLHLHGHSRVLVKECSRLDHD